MSTYTRKDSADFSRPGTKGYQDANAGQNKEHRQDDFVDHQTKR